MTTPERPPDDVFCLTCGPAAVLDRDPAAPVLHCASCGAETQVPALPLFVITGASGAGKTTVTAPLQRLLPECAVFGGDLINQVAALGWDLWRVLTARLRARPSWRFSNREEAVLVHQRFAAWLRQHIDPSWDTSTLTPQELAERIAAWVRSRLP